MSLLSFTCFALLVLSGTGTADDCPDGDSQEDTVCMLHKDLSMIIKPPGPNAKGLTDWDKNFITDKQSGPFYDNRPTTTLKPHSLSAPSLHRSERQMDTFYFTLGIFFMVLLVITIICLLAASGPSLGVNKVSWGFFSEAVSIFCAFLIFLGVKDLFAFGAPYLLQTSFVLLLGLVVVAHIQLFIMRRWPLTLMGTGMVYSYIISFAAVDIFENVEHRAIFTQADFTGRTCLFILLTMGIAVYVFLSTNVREMLEWLLRSSDTARRFCNVCCCCCRDTEALVNDASWSFWKKRADQSEDRLVAVIIGYLISQAVECAILLSSVDHNKSLEFKALALVTASFAVLAMCVGFWTSTGAGNRLNLAALNICLMSAVWCLFHATQWQYDGGLLGKTLQLEANSFRASVLVALTTSFIALATFMVSIIYSLAAHTSWTEAQLNNFQAFAAAVGFALALPWVTCFANSILKFGLAYTHLAVQVTLPTAAIVSLVVLPIWGTFVLPRTIIGKAEHY